MSIILILIAISLSIALIFLLIFIWCMRSGQYDDTFTPAVRMLFENKPPKEKGKDPRADVSFKQHLSLKGVDKPDGSQPPGRMLFEKGGTQGKIE